MLNASGLKVKRKFRSPFGGGGGRKDIFLELSEFTSHNKLFFFITDLLSRLLGVMAENFCLIFIVLDDSNS